LTPQISVHIQRLDDVVTIIDNDPNTQYIHIIDPPLNDPCPHTKVIGRVYDKYEESYTGRGAEGAIDWYAAHRDFIMSRPYVWMWVIGNELQGNRATNAEYMEQMIALLHKDGKLACGGQFSTGTPELADAPLFAKAFAMADAWSFHEYYVPPLGVPGWKVGTRGVIRSSWRSCQQSSAISRYSLLSLVLMAALSGMQSTVGSTILVMLMISNMPDTMPLDAMSTMSSACSSSRPGQNRSGCHTLSALTRHENLSKATSRR
jgi:hypothetical protein